MIGLVTTTSAGRSAAARLAAVLPDTQEYDVRGIEDAFLECDAVVSFLATGATVRLLAPLLQDKRVDPGVVVVDEGLRFAVALLGGHGGGANELARQVADVLGATPVVTTATDAVGLPGLDTLGWPVEGAVAAVSRALLDGEAVRLDADAVWPLPPLPVGEQGRHVVRVTDRVLDGLGDGAEPTCVLRPPSLVLGLGASRGVSADEVLALVDGALADAGLSAACVTAVGTADAKADETGLVAACARRGWPLTTFPADRLAAVAVPNPSAEPQRALGTPSVAEAAALLLGDELVVEKTKGAMSTVAVARRRPRGRLALVGLGPGARDLLTPRAQAELRRASVWVGLDQYVDQVRDLARPGTRLLVTGLGKEEERAHSAVAEAAKGHAVALLGSGDAGVYAMASPALEVAGTDIDVVGVPGVTAALAASSLLGAPLGHDHASISLSDLHTPWPAIEARVRAVASADLVVTFYNPRSRGRDWQLPRAVELLLEHRPADTPVGVVTDASRPTEQVQLTTLSALDCSTVTMYACVVVGSSQSTVVSGRLVTPRGYRWSAAATS
ncbi:MAG: Cobalt-precorrin 5A hydrolase / Cobalt-precorrin-3 C(17)-methyltransferase [uncultured Frankineae bacterium]|uniref:Cobalt-precorrin 5A hydrolase / Cobalt-precorrin-3 C(17)-methyltransferase n=1 Tax=uncultured Frankineae bacterium TaxID=437475 RepID=A0A6J4KLK1_9ACTN|nr:MAG: Cobalt-precorrin 5A hydrolase / Cobalt-precorrin-3 C(17)-methyltransferase [uncultured Frankineae bacterium]